MSPARRRTSRHALLPLALTCFAASGAHAQQTPLYPGNLVVAVEGCGVYGGTCTVVNGTGTGAGNSNLGGYGDNQAAPLNLFQFAPTGTTAVTYVNTLTLPQAVTGANLPVSGEYGSSSEATLQLSGNGQYLTVLGYGVPAATFNAAPAQFGAAPSLALAQSSSLTGQATTAVPRVLALVDARGNVSSSTALYNVFNTNNPRSGYTVDGTALYASGQGASGDSTGGVFLSPTGFANSSPTAITGLDTTGNTVSQDTRTVQVVNNLLYVSVDSKAGSGAARDFIGTLGNTNALPTSLTGAPVQLTGFGNGTGKVTISGNGNGLNEGKQINLSPVNFFFATPGILYVADSGIPKNNSATSTLGNGGLQKWINTAADGSGTWNLAYTLASGLHLVVNTTGTGVAGLYGLTGTVAGGNVQLYSTSYTLSDLDQTFLYGITDTLSATTAAQAASEQFTQLAAAPRGSNYKGVAFTPTVAPETSLVTTSTITRQNGTDTLTLTVSNKGSVTAQDVTLTGVTLGNTSALATPVDLGPLRAGASATTTLTLAAPAAGTTTERITGTTSTGTFGATTRVILP